MTRVRSFQLLVSVSALSYLVWLVLPHTSRTFSPEVERILSVAGYGGQPWVMDPRFYLSLGLAKLVASVGLLLFLAWGRWVFAAVTAISLAIVPFSGIAVGAPLDNLVGYFATLLDGGILTLAFLSPLSEAMRRDE
jgi:hypothetical protein